MQILVRSNTWQIPSTPPRLTFTIFNVASYQASARHHLIEESKRVWYTGMHTVEHR